MFCVWILPVWFWFDKSFSEWLGGSRLSTQFVPNVSCVGFLGCEWPLPISTTLRIIPTEILMHSIELTHRDYERLPPEVKTKATIILEQLKSDLRKHQFSLRFLGHDGQWKDLTPWKFFALSENHYRRQIAGAKWVRPLPREDLLERLSQLYQIVSRAPKVEDRSLEFWSKETSSS